MKLIGNQTNSKNSFSRHIIIKLSKNQRQINSLNAAREKKPITYNVTPMKLLANLSAETL